MNVLSTEWLDLDATNSTLRETMTSYLRGRIGGMIHSLDGMRGCGYHSSIPGAFYYRIIIQFLAEIRSQYIVLSKYALYRHFNYGTFIPMAIFLGAYLLIRDE